MATFLLVHGGFHGAWCWQRLLPLLRAHGHRAEAIDLPYPQDEDASSSDLLQGWASRVVERARAHATPVILVGHSRGGVIISQAAELAPERVCRLIYCGAMLVNDGERGVDVRARLGQPASAPLIVRPGPGTGMIVVDPASAAASIYSECTPAATAWAVARLRAETVAGLNIAPRLTPSRYGAVLRAAIECARDRILPLAFQRAMRSTQPCDAVETLDCDHAPYLSDPVGLSAALDRIAASA